MLNRVEIIGWFQSRSGMLHAAFYWKKLPHEDEAPLGLLCGKPVVMEVVDLRKSRRCCRRCLMALRSRKPPMPIHTCIDFQQKNGDVSTCSYCKPKPDLLERGHEQPSSGGPDPK